MTSCHKKSISSGEPRSVRARPFVTKSLRDFATIGRCKQMEAPYDYPGIFRLIGITCDDELTVDVDPAFDLVNWRHKEDIRLVPLFSPMESIVECIVSEAIGIPTLPSCGIGHLVGEMVGPSVRVGYKAFDSPIRKKPKQYFPKMNRK